MKIKILCLVLLISIIVVALLAVKKVSAPQTAHAQVISTSTPSAILNTPTLSETLTLLKSKHKLTDGQLSLVKRIISCESQNNPNAKHINYQKVVVKEATETEEAVTKLAPWSTDIGYFQLNDFYQQKSAEAKGLDIYTMEGNLEYGFQLYVEQGTDPWNASKYCWTN